MEKLKKVLLWTCLTLATVMVQQLHIEYLCGVPILVMGFFMVPYLKRFSSEVTITTFLGIYVVQLLFFSGNYWNLIWTLEVIWIALGRVKQPKRNIVMADLLFWALVGSPLYVLFLSTSGQGYTYSYIMFYVIFGCVNSVTTILLADVLWECIKYVSSFRKSKTSHNRIHLEPFLYRVMMLVVTIPLIINMLTTNSKSYNDSLKRMEDISINVTQNIQTEVGKWSQFERRKFFLYDVIQRNKILKIFENKASEDQFDIILTNEQDKIILATSELYPYKAKFSMEVIQGSEKVSEIKEVDEAFYRIIPKGRYANQLFIIKQGIIPYKMNVYITIAMNQYMDDLIDKTVNGLWLLIYFWIFIIGMMFVLRRIVFREMEKLVTVTTDLPKHIYDIEQLKWPTGHTKELSVLKENFKRMAYKLNEMFGDIHKLNDELQAQSEDLKKSQTQLHNLAYYDPLTGIGNRLKYKKDMEEIQNQPYHQQQLVGIMLIDMNGFKQINDHLGHDVGDLVLIELANRLDKITQEYPVHVYRLGGDEFVVIAQTLKIEEINCIGIRVKQIFEDSLLLGDNALTLSGSIGISIYPYDAQDMELILKYADMAMYRAKEIKDSAIQYFNATIKAEFERHTEVERNLQQALQWSEFELEYQPIYELKTKKRVGYEALVRWDNKELGRLMTEDFVGVAEEMGLISLIDEWVIKEVCRQIRAWTDAGKDTGAVAVNIAYKTIREKDFLAHFIQYLNEQQIRNNQIILEIEDLAFLEDEHVLAKIVESFKQAGIQICLDNFGKGYCSLNQFMNLPMSLLKIDKELIKDVLKDEQKQKVVSFILDICEYRGIKVRAEGIETKEQMAYLEQTSCCEVQGFLFSKPLEAKEIE